MDRLGTHKQADSKAPHAASQRPGTTQGWRLAALLALVLVALGAAADPYAGAQRHHMQFNRLSVFDGLSHGNVNAIVQDGRGFLWVGTQEGLNRYDGHSMVTFSHDPDAPGSLPNDWVWDLLVDHAGNLWVGTDGGGLSRFDPGTERFVTFRSDPDDPSTLSSDRVRVMLEDADGGLWIGTDGGGLNHMDTATGTFVHYRYEPGAPGSLTNDKIMDLLADRSGRLWVATDGGGLLRFDPRDHDFTAYRSDPTQPDSLADDRVRTLYQDEAERLWVGTFGAGLSRLEPDGAGFRHFRHDAGRPDSMGAGSVNDIARDSDGNLWIATDDGGLCRWLGEPDRFSCHVHDEADPLSLPNGTVNRIFQDEGGVLWIATAAGAASWNYASDAFRVYGVSNSPGSGLSNAVVTSVAALEDGVFWVGTYGGGLNRLDTASGRVVVYRNDPSEPNSLSSDLVMAVHAGADGAVWVGTRDAGLDRRDSLSGRFRHYRQDPKDPDSLSGDGVTRIISDPDGTLWVGTYGDGLNHLDPASGRSTRYRHDPRAPASIGSDRVLALLRDRNNRLWVGTEDAGLGLLDVQTGTFQRYRHDIERRDSLASDTAWDLLEGADGSLWIATMGGGLSRWMPADRRAGRAIFRNYGKAEGLVSNTVLGLLEDGDGMLWLSSNRGLSQLDPSTGSIRHFDDRNGLESNEHMQGARARSPDGKLAFGSTQGLVVLDPLKVRTNQHKPPVAIEVKSSLETLAFASSRDASVPSVELTYRDHAISFEMAALDFASPDKNQFRYRLEGFDSDWVNAGNYPRAAYTNLNAGRYRFVAQAANNDGVWSERSAVVDLRVKPAPWLSFWALGIYASLAAGVLTFYLLGQRRRRLAEAKTRRMLERMVEERTVELSLRNQTLEELNARLESLSAEDVLTKLKNRRYFYQYIEPEIAAVQRQLAALPAGTEQTLVPPSLFFMMIDLDGFKAINDRFGHDAGDRALVQVSDILRANCRAADTIIRWGGDEFLILGQAASCYMVETLAERVRWALAEHQYLLGGGARGRLSASIGVALYPFLPEQPELVDWESVAAIADQAAYIAKANQRNAWVAVYSRGGALGGDTLARVRYEMRSLIDEGLIELRTSITTELTHFSQAAKQVAA
ncbi:ligand-binding sensor domain-containing diguanylate cyclase [Thiocystis violacea]|uniref:ligand-binding sensor domain-containing diguanylate cyclase n=1 Tax=Thiocystis violacea TaxID=13725 RepID=UPI001F5B2CB4|nr:ligand-binding sensor domain-containing diguanylate cyclase [Thiocystis violacea]